MLNQNYFVKITFIDGTHVSGQYVGWDSDDAVQSAKDELTAIGHPFMKKQIQSEFVKPMTGLMDQLYRSLDPQYESIS